MFTASILQFSGPSKIFESQHQTHELLGRPDIIDPRLPRKLNTERTLVLECGSPESSPCSVQNIVTLTTFRFRTYQVLLGVDAVSFQPSPCCIEHEHTLCGVFVLYNFLSANIDVIYPQ